MWGMPRFSSPDDFDSGDFVAKVDGEWVQVSGANQYDAWFLKSEK